MTVDRILSVIAIIVSFIAVPASGYLSYRYAIRGERRKEFNAVADEIRKKLREQLRQIEQGYYPAPGSLKIKDSEIESLSDVIGIRKHKSVNNARRNYHSALMACGDFNESGEFVLNDTASVTKAIGPLLVLLERR